MNRQTSQNLLRTILLGAHQMQFPAEFSVFFVRYRGLTHMVDSQVCQLGQLGRWLERPPGISSQARQTTMQERFSALYADVERRLYSFVFSLVPDRNATDDILQSTMTQLWENFEDYDDSRPFYPWACRFAYRQVLMHRRRETSRHRFFSDTTIELLSKDYPTDDEWEESRKAALQSCMGKLADRQRELISHRYYSDLSISDLATRLGRNVNALYKSLERSRKALADCIRKQLGEEGLS